MTHKKLSDALSELQDRHIDEAVHYKKKRPENRSFYLLVSLLIR